MEVLAISNNPVAARGSKQTQSVSFGHEKPDIESQMRLLAYVEAREQAKARRKKSNRLFNSIPLVAMVSAAILHKGTSKVLNKEISGLAGKLSEGVKAGGYWAYLLGLVGAIGLGEAAISKKSDKFRDFTVNHPFLSFVGNVALYLSAFVATVAGAHKLGSKIKPQYLNKLSNGLENVAGHVNRIKTPKFIKNIGTKLSDFVPNAIKEVKVPDFVKTIGGFTKDIGKTLLKWAPELTLLAGICGSLSAPIRDTHNYVRNYAEIKKAYEEENSN